MSSLTWSGVLPFWPCFVSPTNLQDPLNCFRALPPNPTFPTRSKDFRQATDLSRHWRILLEPISQLLNLSIHQSVDSLYLFLLVRRNWPLSFKLFNQISPSFIPPLPPLQPFSFALDCCEVLSPFFFLFFFPRQGSLLDTAVQLNPARLGFAAKSPFLSVLVCASRSFCQVGRWEMNRQWWGTAMQGCLLWKHWLWALSSLNS